MASEYDGVVTLDGRHWCITGRPHVLFRAERAIINARRKDDQVLVPATGEGSTDVLWFSQRYRLKLTDPKRIRGDAAGFAIAHGQAERIMSGDFSPRVTGFKPGKKPREYQVQASELWRAMKGLLVADELGLGKAQPLDCKVLTPSGWVEIGSLEVGDEVIDPDGGVGQVAGVFDRGVREVFSVTTNDGRSTRCCDEHLWNVKKPNDRNRGTCRVVPLSEIRKELTRTYSGVKLSQWFLPLCEPPRGRDGVGNLPMSPYLLGYLIGDGCMGKKAISVSCYTAEIRELIKKTLPTGVAMMQVTPGVHDYRLSSSVRQSNEVLDVVRSLGLGHKRSWEKSIPKEVFGLKPEDRLEFLRGLMDADGTISKDGAGVTFTSTSEKLADDTRELIESLGGFATKTTRITSFTYKGELKKGRRSYTLIVRLPVCPFHHPMHVGRWKKPYMARPIKKVESCGMAATRCIAVNTKRNLYVTDGYIVTHNTISAATALMDPRLRPAIIVAPTNLTGQWQDVFHEFFVGMRTHVIKQNAYYDLPKYRKCSKCNVWSMQKLRHGKPEHLGVCRKCQHTLVGDCADADIFLTSYHKLHSWVDVLGPVCKSVVFDEAHELRREDSQKYRAASRLCRMVDYRLGLSATPVHNLGGELYNVLDCLQPGSLGVKSDFRRTWCHAYGEAGKEPALTDPAAFGEHLRSQHLMIRRTRDEVGRELPEHTRVIHKIEADSTEIDRIRGRAGDLARLILGKSQKPGDQLNAAGQLEALVRQQTAIAKAPYVAAFVDLILQNGTPVILYGYHRAFYEIVTRELRDHNPLMYTGSETPEKKREMKDRFCVGDSNLLIVSLASGAGLDGLQHRCATGVMGELDWSPARHSQAEGRYHRDGQKMPCMTYYLVCDYGLDPVMTQTLGIKRAQSSGLLQSENDGAISGQSSKYVRELAESFIRGGR